MTSDISDKEKIRVNPERENRKERRDGKPKRVPSREEALLKMADLCARSEQCSSEIEKKLRAKGMTAADISWVVAELHARRFVDETRYARAFARDKVRFAGWGRLKIRAALAAKRIPSAVIAEALGEIEDKDYEEALRRASAAKAATLNLEEYADRVKLARHLYSRGFEPDICNREVALQRGEKRE